MFFFAPCIPPNKTSQQKGIRRTKRTVRNPRGVVFFEREDVRKAREYLRDFILPFRPPQPIPGPVMLGLAFVFPYLASTPKTITRSGILDWHVGTPDWDNVSKGVADILRRDLFIISDAHITLGWVLEARGPDELTGIGVSIHTMPPADESPILRKVRERILEYQRTHPADRGTCPRCWHTFGRAIPMPPKGQPCHKCGRISDREDMPAATFDDVDLFADGLIDPDDLDLFSS